MKTIKNQNGFTMVEATLGTLILSISLFTAILFLNTSTVASANIDFRVIATQFANEQIEEIVMDNQTQPTRYNYITNSNYPTERLDYQSTPNFFERKTNIVEVADDLSTPQVGNGLKKVDATVKWGPALLQKVTLTTVVSDYY